MMFTLYMSDISPDKILEVSARFFCNGSGFFFFRFLGTVVKSSSNITILHIPLHQ